MHEAHDALICIKNKTYVNEKNRIRFSNQHYLKNNSEMSELFADLPEALENNYNFPFRCNFRPLIFKTNSTKYKFWKRWKCWWNFKKRIL